MRLIRVLLTAGAAALATAAVAEKIDPNSVKRGDTGPATTYGETAAEKATKQVMFEFVYLTHVARNPEAAFDKLVSKDYCNHGHLSTGGQKECSDYAETRTRWLRNYGKPVQPGETAEIPRIATVNGEIVTMYGEGVDVFRVHDGKLTDHWDASPPAEANLTAHGPAFAAWVNGDRKGPPPSEPGNNPPGVTVDQTMLTSVDVGPVTPYGETRQEAAAKRVVFEWNHMVMVEGKPKEAFAKYVSKDVCDHSHMVTRGKKDCGGYDQMLNGPFARNAPKKVGDHLEIPTMGSVNGEMVSMYGAGVDIFRVQNGKITDHWDASPPVSLKVNAHTKAFTDRMVKIVAGEIPMTGPGGGPGGPDGGPPPANRP